MAEIQVAMESTPPQSRILKFDLKGKLRTTTVALQHAFQPLFEAVVNSIWATQLRFGQDAPTRGAVTVEVERVEQQHLPGTVGRPPVEAVTALTVTDNGCGFTDANLASFETAYTTLKADEGGKGVGRFTWLVVFERALIDSTFSDSAGNQKRRQFTFSEQHGLADFVESLPDQEGDLRTIVRLVGVESRYSEPLRRSSDFIADRLLEHCFNFFVLGRCPAIYLVDVGASGNRERTRLNDRLAEFTQSEVAALQVGGHVLQVRHVQRKYAVGRKHEYHLCADYRVVKSGSLSSISNLGQSAIRSADGQQVVHQVFVTGDALDAAADSTRTRLDLPDNEPLLAADGTLDLQTLREALGAHVNERLADVLREEIDNNFGKIERHIRTVQPEYRHLLTHCRELLSRLTFTDNQEQLDEELYKVQQNWELQVRRRIADVEKNVEENTELEQIADRLYQVITEAGEVGQANLVRYVTRRRAVLKLLTHLISKSADTLEKAHPQHRASNEEDARRYSV